jgi:circadian clock protein KaiB
LYVAGLSPNSLRAQQNLRDATNAMKDAAALLNVEVIDVFKGPKRAIADGILVTPTLVAHYSGKRVMMVGDLGDSSAVRSILDACASAADG